MVLTLTFVLWEGAVSALPSLGLCCFAPFPLEGCLSPPSALGARRLIYRFVSLVCHSVFMFVFFFVFTFFQWFLFFFLKKNILVNFCCLPFFNIYCVLIFSFSFFSSRFYYYQYFHVSFNFLFHYIFFGKKEKGGGSTRDVFTRKVALSEISPPGHLSTHAEKKTKVP